MGTSNYPGKIHRLSKEDILERNAKIQRMVEIGASYSDIGRRYGLTESTVRSMVSKGKVKAGVTRLFGSPGNLSRSMFVDD